MLNVPETEFDTENSCKSPTDCPDDDEGRDNMPWTAVNQQTLFDDCFIPNKQAGGCCCGMIRFM